MILTLSVLYQFFASEEKWIRSRKVKVDQKMKYTQREWDRTVGWGKVPEEYSHTVSTGKTDGENTERMKRLEKRTKELLKRVKNIR